MDAECELPQTATDNARASLCGAGVDDHEHLFVYFQWLTRMPLDTMSYPLAGIFPIMSSTAQILANRQNAEWSTGPVTAEGKARVSQNANKLGLFSVANFVRPEERQIFTEFESGYMSELSPATPLEQTLSREIVQAAWRLRRCAALETTPPENMTEEDLDRLQVSIDRARAAAQRTFHRSLKELRRHQSEHLEPAALMIKHAMATDALLLKDLEDRQRQFAAESAARNSAKQTQSQPEKTASIPRSAPCPCRSGEKYKRCCGKNAPPVLSARAA